MPGNNILQNVSFQSAIHDVQVYGLIMLDPDGRVVSWNLGATHLLGYNEPEVLGQHFEFIFTSEDCVRKVPQSEMATALRQGYAYDDRWHVRKDRSQIYVNGGLCLLKTEAGQPLGFVKIIRDQTEKRDHLEKIEDLNAKLLQAHSQMELYASMLEEKVNARTRELNERNGELQDFCYSIAHDLRAPLRSIQAMSQVVVEDYGKVLDSKGKEYLGRIAKAGSHLDQLTIDLLNYTRFSRQEINLTTIGMEGVVDEVLLTLGESIVQKSATVNVQRPLPHARGQHSYAVQILSNFISNALKFVKLESKPFIEIWAETTAERTRIYVKDNGIGISPEYQAKIFLLFERLHPQGSFEGTGVGLAIARKAAQRMNGEVGVITEREKGSTFWLELEAAE